MADAAGPDAVIGGFYTVDVTRRLPDAAGGMEAYAANDRRSADRQLMAVRVDRFAPPNHLTSLVQAGNVDGMLCPVAHGVGPRIGGTASYFVIGPVPPGPPLSVDLRPWPEAVIIECVLRPIAQVLEQLQTSGLTHRGIRPNNVFQFRPNRPVTLGQSWAAPPAMHQPTAFETPYAALCHPAGRGSGRIADDVYALGVLLITLALGRVPMDGQTAEAIIHRKLDAGDFTALTAGERLPPMLADIARGMLAEDPDHRPQPSLLRDPTGARGRRVAARPPQRASRPLMIGRVAVWNSRTLALALTTEPAEAAAAMQTGVVMSWVRRSLGEPALGTKLEDLYRHHARDALTDPSRARCTLLMCATVAADPLMPLVWEGLVMFPDGAGPLLAAVRPGDAAFRLKLLDIIMTEASGTWAELAELQSPAPVVRLEARKRRGFLQIVGLAGGLPRLTYALNPLLPCLSPLLDDDWIDTPKELTAALDRIAEKSPQAELMEPDIVAFVAERTGRALEQEIKGLTVGADEAAEFLMALRLMTEMQRRFQPIPLVNLTAWLERRARPQLERWNNRERRAVVESRLKALSAAGLLQPILTLLDDPMAQDADARGLRDAIQEVAEIDATLRNIEQGGTWRAETAARLGQEIAVGIGLSAVTAALLFAALG